MIWDTTCAAVIPCFNEAGNLRSLLRQVQVYLPRIIVVDDASTDGTATEAAAAGAVVIRHDRNQGKGAALRSGLAEASRQGLAWAIVLDGDGQHRPGTYSRILASSRTNRCGSGCWQSNARCPGSFPGCRRWVNRWMSRWISRRAGQVFPDSQCGFRLIKLAVWAHLPIQSNHFEIESEMLLVFAASRLSGGIYPHSLRPGHPAGAGSIRSWTRGDGFAGGHEPAESPWEGRRVPTIDSACLDAVSCKHPRR